MSKNKKSANIWVQRELLESRAWLELKKPSSYKVLMRFFMKRQVWNRNINHPRKKKDFLKDKEGNIKIVNNGEIEFCYTEARRHLGLSTATFTAALDELLAHGFIDITRTGHGVERIKTLFAISDRWRAYGTPDFISAAREKRPTATCFCKGKRDGKK